MASVLESHVLSLLEQEQRKVKELETKLKAVQPRSILHDIGLAIASASLGSITTIAYLYLVTLYS